MNDHHEHYQLMTQDKMMPLFQSPKAIYSKTSCTEKLIILLKRDYVIDRALVANPAPGGLQQSSAPTRNTPESNKGVLDYLLIKVRCVVAIR